MKLLLVTQAYLDSFPPRNLSMGSAVKQARQLSAEHQVTVLTCGRRLPEEQINPNLRVISVPGWLIPDPVNYIVSPALLIRFVQLVRTLRPDVVMVSKFMFFSSLVIPLAKLLSQKVVTTTDTFPGINWFPRSKIVAAVMWIYARLIGLPLLWLSDRVILLYPGLKPVADRFGINSIVIPNGVEPELLRRLPRPQGIKKPKGEFWVGFVGRAESVKGFDLAVQTADRLRDIPDIRFVFAGGNQRNHSSGNCKFLGFRPDIYRLYQLFDCLILPSFAEGLPNAVMEAMAQKVPVIASPVGGVRYLITDHKTGLWADSRDPGDFSLAILKLYTDTGLKRRLGAAAHRYIAGNYAWSAVLPVYRKLFISLADRQR